MNLSAVLVMGAILLVLLSALLLLPVFCVKQFRRNRIAVAVGSGVVWLLLLGGFLRVAHGVLPGKNVILARTTAPGGVEMCVTHRSNYSAEPYTVSFYYKRPHQPWGWFYYEHEDTRWLRGSIEVNDEGTMAFIKRGRAVVATFDLTTDSFTIKRWNRTLRGTQEWMPDGWTPEHAIGEDAS